MILINNIEIQTETFPNGEVKIKSQDIDDLINEELGTQDLLTLKYESPQDLLNLIFIKRHIDENYNTQTSLRIAYMPYSRMDRTKELTVFTLKYMAEIINSLNFISVFVQEPHSDVTIALLNNCFELELSKELLSQKVDNNIIDKESYLVFPDSSADKRYNDGGWENTLTCIKQRDFETGRIKSLEIVGEKPTKPFKAVIIDDICSKGGTFKLVGEKLKEMGATEIVLVVGHCEDSIYEGDILNTNVIDRVYTTNSILSEVKHEKLDVVDCLITRDNQFQNFTLSI